MTPAERIERAFDDASLLIADYLQPGHSARTLAGVRTPDLKSNRPNLR